MFTDKDYKIYKLQTKHLAALKLNGYTLTMTEFGPRIENSERIVATYNRFHDKWDVRVSADYTEQVFKLRQILGKYRAF